MNVILGGLEVDADDFRLTPDPADNVILIPTVRVTDTKDRRLR